MDKRIHEQLLSLGVPEGKTQQVIDELFELEGVGDIAGDFNWGLVDFNAEQLVSITDCECYTNLPLGDVISLKHSKIYLVVEKDTYGLEDYLEDFDPETGEQI